MARLTGSSIVGWAAICAVLLQAFVPLATHIRAVEPASGWAEICTTDGVKQLVISAVRSGEEPARSVPDSQHCLYCVTNVTSHGAPPSDRVLVISSVERRYTRAPAADHVRAGAVWRTPQSRAPPVA